MGMCRDDEPEVHLPPESSLLIPWQRQPSFNFWCQHSSTSTLPREASQILLSSVHTPKGPVVNCSHLRSTTRTLIMPLIDQCGKCSSTEKLQRCAKCQVLFYCSKEHQVADWEVHKTECKEFTRARKTLKDMEAQIGTPLGFRNLCSTIHPNGMMGDPPYMKAHYTLSHWLSRVNTKASVEAELHSTWRL